MQLIWYGLSCFLLKSNTGKRILINPFKNLSNYNTIISSCDLIIDSNPNNKYPNLNIIDSTTKIINSAGSFDLGFCKIEGINLYHDNMLGLKRGPNIIYVILLDNISICNLGYLGHIPNKDILSKLTNMNFLLIPIGGHFTLDGYNAAKICNLIYPDYIIPMYYKSINTDLNLYDCKNFILSLKDFKITNMNILNISEMNKFEGKSQIILLKDHNLIISRRSNNILLN